MIVRLACCYVFFFFFNDTATTEIYTLSLHDALPIWLCSSHSVLGKMTGGRVRYAGHLRRHHQSLPLQFFRESNRVRETCRSSSTTSDSRLRLGEHSQPRCLSGQRSQTRHGRTSQYRSSRERVCSYGYTCQTNLQRFPYVPQESYR